MARISASDRARRLIALFRTLREANGTRIPLDDLARAVDATPEQLEEDLTLLSMCGLQPFDPLACVPVFVEDGDVVVWGELPALRGGVRLASKEARALAAALQAAGFDEHDELVTRLLSAAASGTDPEAIAQALRATTSNHDTSVYETVAAACASSELLRIEYQRVGVDHSSARDIEPQLLFSERGVWYVSGYCHLAGEPRTFRLDRIRSAERAGRTFEPRQGVSRSARAFDGSGLPRATLAFCEPASFEEREWPGGSGVGEDADGRLLVEVPYGGTGWIARQVVARMGAVEVLEPADVRSAVHELAIRELARLQDDRC